MVKSVRMVIALAVVLVTVVVVAVEVMPPLPLPSPSYTPIPFGYCRAIFGEPFPPSKDLFCFSLSLSLSRHRCGSPMEIFRRGVYPFYYGKKVACVLKTEVQADEADKWDDCILVSYPSRNTAVQMLIQPSYNKRVVHRQAAMEKAIVRPTTPWPKLVNNRM